MKEIQLVLRVWEEMEVHLGGHGEGLHKVQLWGSGMRPEEEELAIVGLF